MRFDRYSCQIFKILLAKVVFSWKLNEHLLQQFINDFGSFDMKQNKIPRIISIFYRRWDNTFKKVLVTWEISNMSIKWRYLCDIHQCYRISMTNHWFNWNKLNLNVTSNHVSSPCSLLHDNFALFLIVQNATGLEHIILLNLLKDFHHIYVYKQNRGMATFET